MEYLTENAMDCSFDNSDESPHTFSNCIVTHRSDDSDIEEPAEAAEMIANKISRSECFMLMLDHFAQLELYFSGDRENAEEVRYEAALAKLILLDNCENFDLRKVTSENGEIVLRKTQNEEDGEDASVGETEGRTAQSPDSIMFSSHIGGGTPDDKPCESLKYIEKDPQMKSSINKTRKGLNMSMKTSDLCDTINLENSEDASVREKEGRTTQNPNTIVSSNHIRELEKGVIKAGRGEKKLSRKMLFSNSGNALQESDKIVTKTGRGKKKLSRKKFHLNSGKASTLEGHSLRAKRLNCGTPVDKFTKFQQYMENYSQRKSVIDKTRKGLNLSRKTCDFLESQKNSGSDSKTRKRKTISASATSSKAIRLDCDESNGFEEYVDKSMKSKPNSTPAKCSNGSLENMKNDVTSRSQGKNSPKKQKNTQYTNKLCLVNGKTSIIATRAKASRGKGFNRRISRNKLDMFLNSLEQNLADYQKVSPKRQTKTERTSPKKTSEVQRAKFPLRSSVGRTSLETAKPQDQSKTEKPSPNKPSTSKAQRARFSSESSVLNTPLERHITNVKIKRKLYSPQTWLKSYFGYIEGESF